MRISKSSNDSPKEDWKLRNFDLSVEEIKVSKAISDMTKALDDLERKNSHSVRLEYFRDEIRKLEDQLEEIRDNTLIR